MWELPNRVEPVTEILFMLLVIVKTLVTKWWQVVQFRAVANLTTVLKALERQRSQLTAHLRRVELALTALNVSPARKRAPYQSLESQAPVSHKKGDVGNGARPKKAS
jgi:hypothetical protein